MKIGIDVDGVLCDTGTTWIDWMIKTYVDVIIKPEEFKQKMYQCDSWEINTLAEQLLKDTVVPTNIEEFWLSSTLYDNIKPNVGSVSAIEYFKELGYEVFFVSSCFPEHQRSKYNWLKTHYNSDALIACPSQHKHRIPAFDIFIEDRPATIQALVDNTNTKCIQFVTKFYNIGTIINERVSLYDNWSDIKKNWSLIIKK